MRYKVLTEKRDRREEFANFNTNKKASKQTPQVPEGDTPNGARSNVLDAQLADKVTATSSSNQKTGSDLTSVNKNTQIYY